MNHAIMLLWIKSGEIHIHLSNHHIPHASNLLPDALLKILITLVMLCDFSLPLQYKWGLHSSGMLHNNEWYVYVQPIGCETLANTSVTGNDADLPITKPVLAIFTATHLFSSVIRHHIYCLSSLFTKNYHI